MARVGEINPDGQIQARLVSFGLLPLARRGGGKVKATRLSVSAGVLSACLMASPSLCRHAPRHHEASPYPGPVLPTDSTQLKSLESTSQTGSSLVSWRRAYARNLAAEGVMCSPTSVPRNSGHSTQPNPQAAITSLGKIGDPNHEIGASTGVSKPSYPNSWDRQPPASRSPGSAQVAATPGLSVGTVTLMCARGACPPVRHRNIYFPSFDLARVRSQLPGSGGSGSGSGSIATSLSVWEEPSSSSIGRS